MGRGALREPLALAWYNVPIDRTWKVRPAVNLRLPFLLPCFLSVLDEAWPDGMVFDGVAGSFLFGFATARGMEGQRPR